MPKRPFDAIRGCHSNNALGEYFLFILNRKYLIVDSVVHVVVLGVMYPLLDV